jgi:peptidyl-dipeptidase A
MKKLIVIWLAVMIMASCTSPTNKMEQELKTFIDSLEIKAKPAEAGAALAYFNATTTGKEEEYDKYSKFNIEVSKFIQILLHMQY